MLEFDYMITIGSKGGSLSCICTGDVPADLRREILRIMSGPEPPVTPPNPPPLEPNKPLPPVEFKAGEPIGEQTFFLGESGEFIIPDSAFTLKPDALDVSDLPGLSWSGPTQKRIFGKATKEGRYTIKITGVRNGKQATASFVLVVRKK